MSQRSAARMMGISQTRLISLENGRDRNTGRPTIPSPELTTRIALAYQYPKQQLLLLAGYSPWVLEEPEVELLLLLAASAARARFDLTVLSQLCQFMELPLEKQQALLRQASF